MKRRAILAGSTLALSVGLAGCFDRATAADLSSATSDEQDQNESEIDSNSDTCATTGSETDSENELDEKISIRQLEDEEVNASPLTRDFDIEVPENPIVAEAIQVGASNDSHWVTILAESETPVEISIQTDQNESVHQLTTTLSTSQYVAIRFEKPDDYVVECLTDDFRSEFRVRESNIDCNRSDQTVLLRGDGSIDETHISDLALCISDLDKSLDQNTTSLEDLIEEQS